MVKLETQDVNALCEAYEATCRTHALYGRVIQRLGALQPFAALHDDAARQVEQLEGVLRRYGIVVRYPGEPQAVKRFTTIPQAVAAAFTAERTRAALSQAADDARDPVANNRFARVEPVTDGEPVTPLGLPSESP